jgi:hypothetical protein
VCWAGVPQVVIAGRVRVASCVRKVPLGAQKAPRNEKTYHDIYFSSLFLLFSPRNQNPTHKSEIKSIFILQFSVLRNTRN